LKKLIPIILLLAFAVGGFFGWKAYNSDERRITRKLQALPELLTWNPRDGNIVRLGRANNLKEMLAQNITIEVNVGRGEVRGIEGRQEVYQALLAAQSSGMALKVEIPAIKATVTSTEAASAELTTFLYVGNDNREPFLQELAMELVKVEGEWLISKVRTIRTLSN